MDTRKGAVTKAFFPSVKKRLTQKIPIFPELTTMVTGHGNIKSYLYRLGLTDNRMCLCEEEEQTVDHLIFKCKKLRNQREEMIRQIKTLVAVGRPPVWSSGQSFWLQLERSRVRSPALPDFLSSSGSGTWSTQPREPREVN